MGNCAVEGSPNQRKATYCGSHEWRLRQHGDVLALVPIGRLYNGRKRATVPPTPKVQRTFPPGSGRHPCPECGSARLTLPWQPGKPLYRCCACSIDFTPVAA